jgi:Putative polyhydroxyalkanoic acid system protein (PHA_gran_rgn)
MPQPLVVTIPHRLGQEEATTRLEAGLQAAGAKFGQLISVQEEVWTGNRLQFRLSALTQSVAGTIEVFEDHVRLEVILPWLLAAIAAKIQPLIQKEGTQLLEKK